MQFNVFPSLFKNFPFSQIKLPTICADLKFISPFDSKPYFKKISLSQINLCAINEVILLPDKINNFILESINIISFYVFHE